MNAVDPGMAAAAAGARPLLRARRRSFFDKNRNTLVGFASVAATLALWEACWQGGLIPPLFFSGPSAIAVRFVELIADGTLAKHAAYSGKNFIIGFVLAVIVAVPLGVVLGWYRLALAAFDPLINALYAMPRIALYPLFIIWFGIGIGSKIFIVFLSAVLPILINTLAGVRNIDADLLKAARAFCATDRQIFTSVALPYSVPFILTGIRQGVAHGLIGVIVGEIFAGSEGLGFMISYAGQLFQTDTLLVGVLVTATAGIVLTALAARLQRYFQRWKPEHVGN